MAMKKVFISYAREDIEIAKKIYNDLASKGVDVWLDENDLIPGQKWKIEIKKAISESRYFIALLSSNSVSKKGYVQKELKIALDVFDLYPEDEKFIIPIRIDECKPRTEKLNDFHWADLFPDYETGIRKILRALKPLENEKTKPDSETYAGKLLKKINEQSNFETRAGKLSKKLNQLVIEKPLPVSDIAVSNEEEEKSTVIKPITPEPATQEKQGVRLRKHRKPSLVKGVMENIEKIESRKDKKDFQDNGNGTVTDCKTGLMWQQSGSAKNLAYKEAQAYVQHLNQKYFADHNDWRLPTVEELESLLEGYERSNNMYIDPIFDKNQRICWSSTSLSSERAFVVYFNHGEVGLNLLDMNYVRVVRATQ